MIGPVQRYVSQELTHFVGKAIQDGDALPLEEKRDAQYELLAQILESGRLLARGGWIGPLDERPESVQHSIGFNPAEAGLNEMITPAVVCFCDIPPDDFHVHISKYSPFGLSFDKSWLVARGANPVFYIAQESRVPALGRTAGIEDTDRETVYTETLRGLVPRLGLVVKDALEREDQETATQTARALYFLLSYVGPLLKMFPAGAPEDHPEAFYLEREMADPGRRSVRPV